MKRVFAFIGFTAAITLILLNIIPFSAIKYILILAVALLIVSLLVKFIRCAKVIPIVLISVIFACLIFMINYSLSYYPISALGGQSADISFKIIDLPTMKDDGTYSYIVNVTSVDIPNAPQNFRLRLNTDNPIEAEGYRTVNAFVVLSKFADTAFDSYGCFSDGIYLSSKLISYEVTEDVDHCLGYYLLEFRTYVNEVLADNLDSVAFPLAISVFTGDKSYLSSEVISDFKICGISHIIAVSGLHISILCLGIYHLLKFLKVPKLCNSMITLFVLFIYSGLANFSESVIRSAIMVTVLILSEFINKKADTLNSLGIAVFIICLNPYAVADISALLTVTAVIGIVVVKRAIDKAYLPKKKIIRYFYDAITVGLSVLMTTFPVMWLYFGSVSIIGVFINIIVIPLLQFSLVSIIIICIFSGVPFLAFIPNIIAGFSLKSILYISHFCAEHFSFLFFDVSSLVFGMAAAGIILFLSISVLMSGTIKTKIALPFVLAVMFLSSVLCIYEKDNTVCLYIDSDGAVFAYDKDTLVAVGVDDKNDNYTYQSLTENRNYKFIDCVDCAYFDSDNQFGQFCENISVSESYDNIILTVCDKVFEISDDYVTINNNSYVRDINGRYSIDSDVVLKFNSKEG